MTRIPPQPRRCPHDLTAYEAEESLEAIMQRMGRKFFSTADTTTTPEPDAPLTPAPPGREEPVPSQTPIQAAPSSATPPREGGWQRLGAVLEDVVASPASFLASVAPADLPPSPPGPPPAPVRPRSTRGAQGRRATSAKQTLPEVVDDDARAPTRHEIAFLARQLIQATLPHKNPGDVPVWRRRNGDFTLGIRPGVNMHTGQNFGYPYGTVPRLLLFWMTTEALRTKQRRLELGDSLTAFMQQLGLTRQNGSPGAKRSDARRLHDQMQRLFRSVISFEYVGKVKHAWLDMHVAPEGMLWWDALQPESTTRKVNWIQLDERFFQALTSAAVPVDMRILRSLKHSPLALDFYAWATYTAFQTQQTGRARSISWALLHAQFGAEYGTVKDFAKKAWAALQKVQVVYPALTVVRVRGGLKVLPCMPSVSMRSAGLS